MKKTVQRILLTFIVSSLFLTACNSRTNEENTSNEKNLTIHSSKQEVTADESNNGDSQDSTRDNEGLDGME